MNLRSVSGKMVSRGFVFFFSPPAKYQTRTANCPEMPKQQLNTRTGSLQSEKDILQSGTPRPTFGRQLYHFFLHYTMNYFLVRHTVSLLYVFISDFAGGCPDVSRPGSFSLSP